jgi:Ca-activated chloride channel homolog
LRYNRSIFDTVSWLFIAFFFCAFLKTPSGLNNKGNDLFEEKRYESALEAYREAQVRDPESSEIRYNLGTTLYQLDQFQEADHQLKESLEGVETKKQQARAWYNYGNTQYRLGQFDEAIQAYKNALDINPDDEDAKFNLEVLQNKKSAFDESQKQRDDQKEGEQPRSRQGQDKNQQGGGSGRDQSKPQEDGEEQRDPQQGQGGSRQEQPKDQGEEEESEGQEEEQESQGEEQQQGRFGDQEEEPQDQQGDQQQDSQQAAGQEQREVNRPLLQGQMSQSDAMRILDALHEGEQELQLLRRPSNPQQEHEPLKDW